MTLLLLPIIAFNPYFVVLDKPAGLSFHSDDGAGLVVQAEQQLGVKLYPVHRLDKVTSGLLILARTPEAAAEFTALFSHHQIEKYYLALSAHKPKRKQGWVKGDMVPARRGAWKLLPSLHNPAVSYFISQGFEQLPFRAYLVKPFSGKTHQIRVALKSASVPISGDVLYGAEAADRVYLHAYGLSFTFQQQLYQFVCLPQHGALFRQLPAAFFEQWQQPWQLNWPDYHQPDSK